MKDLLKLIKIGHYEFPVEISKEAKDLVRNLLILKPEDRLTLPEILNHPWMKEPGEDSETETESEAESKESTPAEFKSDDI